MTKKHYEAIAAILKGRDTLMDRKRAVTSLADFFQTDNPKFDRTRFLQACGIEHYPTCPLCQLRDGEHRTFCKYEQDK